MNAHIDIGRYLPDDFIREVTTISRGLPGQTGIARFQRWNIFPYGWWEEHDGSFVIFDRKYRPLCRKRPNGSIESVSPWARIDFVRESFFYRAGHPETNDDDRRRVFGAVYRLDLLPELMRRRGLERLQKRRRRLHLASVWMNRAIGCGLAA